MKGKASGWIIIFFTIIYSSNGFGQPSYQPDTIISNWISQDLFTHASIGVYMQDAETGEVTHSSSPGLSLAPASTQKLLTTAAALEILGPDYRFSTSLAYTGEIHNDTLNGDLIILGGGDPALGSKYFKDHYFKHPFLTSWTDSLEQHHIRHIQGNILTDASVYEDQMIPDTWIWEDIGNYYGAGACGLSVYDNLYEIHLSSPSMAGQPTTIISTNPVIPNLEFDNQVLSSDKQQDLAYVFGSPLDSKRILRGTIPKGKSGFIVKASIPDPPYLLGWQLRKILEAGGITVTGEIKKRKKEQTEKPVSVIATTFSPPLIDIIRVTNHESVNLFAEHLLKQISYLNSGVGSTEEGTHLIIDFWKDRGIDTRGLFMCDGSGLSRFNAITPRQMVQVLDYMKNKSRNSNLFFSSLPSVPNGTLYYFNPDNFPNNGLRAKSGSMTRVRCFAGLLKTTSGRELLFAVFINNFSCSQSKAIHAIENLLVKVSRK